MQELDPFETVWQHCSIFFFLLLLLFLLYLERRNAQTQELFFFLPAPQPTNPSGREKKMKLHLISQYIFFCLSVWLVAPLRWCVHFFFLASFLACLNLPYFLGGRKVEKVWKVSLSEPPNTKKIRKKTGMHFFGVVGWGKSTTSWPKLFFFKLKVIFCSGRERKTFAILPKKKCVCVKKTPHITPHCTSTQPTTHSQ